MTELFQRIRDGPADGRRNRTTLDRKTRLRLVFSYLPDWILTIVLVALVSYFTNFEGHKREFSLTDTSIQHTFATHERVTFQMAIVYAAAIPAGLIVLIAVFWRKSLWDAHNGLLGLILGLALATAITNIVKVTVGRPRPDLIDRCQPIGGAVNMSPFGLANLTVCTVQTGHTITDGFKSFPSGHSSFSFAGLGFLSLYWSGKMHLFDQRGHAIKAWIALVPLMGAALIAISRTMDNRHHATDVLVGSGLGLAMALFAYSLYYPPLSSPQAHLPFAPRSIHSSTAADSLPPPAVASGRYEEDDTVPLGTFPRPVDGRGVGGSGERSYAELRGGEED